MTKFWGKLFLINFAMGVVTGIVQEFQFGMNWSEYSRFVGDIFGAPLAIEALLAFFLESTFLGIWIFGWDRLPQKVHLLTIWLVAIGCNISALWILIANSFMQEPVGYVAPQRPGGDDRLRRPGHQPARLGAVAARLLRGPVHRRLLHARHRGLAAAHARIATRSSSASRSRSRRWRPSSARVLVILVGHSQAQHMVQTQPMKMAAAEALWDTESPAGMSLFTIGDTTEPQGRLRDPHPVRAEHPGLQPA